MRFQYKNYGDNVIKNLDIIDMNYHLQIIP